MKISLKQAYDLFIFDRETYCLESTIRNYRNTLRYFIDFMEQTRGQKADEIDMDSITNTDLNSYVIMLRNRKKLVNHPYKPTSSGSVSKRTILTYSIDLRSFFNFLFKNEYIQNDLMKKFKMIKQENKLVLPLYENEVRQIDELYNARTETGARNLCIIHLMLDAGFRSGEVCGLHVADVNFNENHIVVLNGKGSKDRIVPLAGNLKKLLYHYLYIYRPAVEHDFLLVNLGEEKDPLSQDAIKSLFSRIRIKTGIARLKPHLLRHTFATSYILGGGDLESLRIFLGHASYDTTQEYLHLANTYKLMNGSIYKLDKIFFKRYYQ